MVHLKGSKREEVQRARTDSVNIQERHNQGFFFVLFIRPTDNWHR